MAEIPSSINGVQVEFADTVVNDVDDSLVSAMKQCITSSVATGHTLSKIYVSSASDSHPDPNSRHSQNKAVDISRINGTKIALGYPSDATVTAIVKAIQEGFESYPSRRENFGPYLKKKLGQDWTVSGHNDHIHLSVN